MVGYLISHVSHVEHMTSEFLKTYFTFHMKFESFVLIYKILFNMGLVTD